jgi:hypothetical protein
MARTQGSKSKKLVVYRRCIDRDCAHTFQAQITKKLPKYEHRLHPIKCTHCNEWFAYFDWHSLDWLTYSESIENNFIEQQRYKEQLQYGIAWACD